MSFKFQQSKKCKSQYPVTVLLNSCDKYSDAWDPFFKLLYDYWENCPCDIALNTETKEYKSSFFDVRVIHPITEGQISWSKRFREALMQIDSDYILFMMEDFFLQGQVNTEIFDNAVDVLNNDKSVGAIILYTTSKENIKKSDYNNSYFYSRIINEKFKAWCVPILYRKDFLLKLIRDYESVWEFETLAWLRAKMTGKLLLQQSNDYSPTFNYTVNVKSGFGITKGKWLPNNQKLFEEHGIYNVNYDALGRISVEEAVSRDFEQGSEPKVKSTEIKEIVHKCRTFPKRIKKKIKKSAVYHLINKK